MPRSALLKSVVGCFILLACGFVFILFSSLGNKTNEKKSASFADILEGQTALRRVANQRLWITRLNEVQREQLITTHACRQRAFCAFTAATNTAGIELVFSSEKPPQVNDRLPWNGGFIDPTNGTVYDIGGIVYDLKADSGAANLSPVTID